MDNNHEEKIKSYRLSINDVLKSDPEALAIFLVMMFRDSLCVGIPWVDDYCRDEQIESDNVYELEHIMNWTIEEEVEVCKKWLLNTDASANQTVKAIIEKKFGFQQK